MLPDLAHSTIQKLSALRTEIAMVKRVTYKYGYLFNLQLKKVGRLFSFHTPFQLPSLFTFLDVEAIVVLNWLKPSLLSQTFHNNLSGLKDPKVMFQVS